MLIPSLLLTACEAECPDGQPCGETAGDSPGEESAAGPTESAIDSGDSAEEIVPDTFVDVIVVGSGPAGCAAALEAQAAGASVLMFEREETPGLGVQLAGLAFGVGTPWQAGVGVTDTVEIAAAEWSGMTGASGTLASVQQFLAATAPTLGWLEGLGALISGPMFDYDAGRLPRLHAIGWGADSPFLGLMASYAGDLRVGTEVVGPWMENGVLRGVQWRTVATDTPGYTGGAAVVIATGGFLRNRDRVDAAAPELADRDLVFETNPSSNGGGLPFLDAIGAGSLTPEAIGLYVHAISDPLEAEGEAMVANLQRPTLLVGESSERFVDESLLTSFDLFQALPVGRVYAVTAGVYAENVQFMRPAYNWADVSVEEFFTLADIEAMGSPALYRADDMATAATMAGLDASVLQGEIDGYNTAATTATADEFGRYAAPNETIEGAPALIIELTPGLAKAFGGVATDTDARVIDGSGTPIPGLYAAGEVTGMIIGGGGGDGFSGSVSACYAGGRTAGINAAVWAAAGN